MSVFLISIQQEDFADCMTKGQLFDLFKERLGPGQARALAKKSKK
ncbi:MAG TPA: hypothetical protein VMV77_21170 [Bacteroidales bacterium]|nr:hypothetical protein [Bacteroidales bacterium]